MDTDQLVSRVSTSGVAFMEDRPNPARAAVNDLLKSALKRRLGGVLGGLEKTIARVEKSARSGGR